MALFGKAQSSGVTEAPRQRAPRAALYVALTASNVASRTLVGVSLFLALLVPSAQIAWGWLALIWLALGLAARFAWNSRGADVLGISITPNDDVNLRRRYEKEEIPVKLRFPIFVSPWLVCFQTQGQGAVMLHAGQTDARNWRALRVRLKHLRVAQAFEDDVSKSVM